MSLYDGQAGNKIEQEDMLWNTLLLLLRLLTRIQLRSNGITVD